MKKLAHYPLAGRSSGGSWLIFAESAFSKLHSPCLLAKLIWIKSSYLIRGLLPHRALPLLSPSAGSLQICIRGNQMMASQLRISPWLLLQVKCTLLTPPPIACKALCGPSPLVSFSAFHTTPPPHSRHSRLAPFLPAMLSSFPSQDLALLFPLPAMLFLYVLISPPITKTSAPRLSLRPQPQDFPETFPEVVFSSQSHPFHLLQSHCYLK